MKITTVGSVCSGIEAASVAWSPLGLQFQWFSEIADFPSRLLSEKYPETENVGDMKNISGLIKNRIIASPDLICGGTPCQAFSLAGFKNGLNDDRGNLTLKFVDIIDSNDEIRLNDGSDRTIVFWENVEGVLTDKTNAFGCLLSSLAGFDDVIAPDKWAASGILHGPKRNIAWRVLDAKFFGVPQQRRRLYLLAGGTDFYPENILFERNYGSLSDFPSYPLIFQKDGHLFEVFREYTDCLYSAYGTKWNGNAAAYNGSLFVVQDGRIRRLSPLETERLMGFPDEYTKLEKARKTNRYQATGNSWAVPVVRWIGSRIIYPENTDLDFSAIDISGFKTILNGGYLVQFDKDLVSVDFGITVNATPTPEECIFSSMKDIVSADAPDDIYISPVGCYGIVRRKQERRAKINPTLERTLLRISSEMPPEEIEQRSRIQKRGRYSDHNKNAALSSAEKTAAI